MNKKELPVTCPLCGRMNRYSLEILLEGSTLTCRFCKVQLKLHGHMWDYVQTEIDKIREKH